MIWYELITENNSAFRAAYASKAHNWKGNQEIVTNLPAVVIASLHGVASLRSVVSLHDMASLHGIASLSSVASLRDVASLYVVAPQCGVPLRCGIPPLWWSISPLCGIPPQWQRSAHCDRTFTSSFRSSKISPPVVSDNSYFGRTCQRHWLIHDLILVLLLLCKKKSQCDP